MPCIKLPIPQIPTLPLPLQIPTITVSPVGIDEMQFCCKLPAFKTPSVRIPFSGITLIPGFATGLAAAQKAITDYINALPLKCPIE